MENNNSLIFFGTENFSAIILSRLLQAGYDIKAVVTKPDAMSGRGGRFVAPRAKQIAREHNIPALQPKNLGDALEAIAGFGCNHAVLVAYGKIIPDSILALFGGGIINVHPSLLPEYRGPSPIESAILNSDEKTGVSLMKLVPKMDAGSVYAQVEYSLGGFETRYGLYEALTETSAKLLLEHLPAILDGSLQPVEQNEQQASYCHLIKKQDGIINWNKPAAQIEREIRGYLGWPSSQAKLFDQDITMLEATISDVALAPGEVQTTNFQLIIGTGLQSLEIKKLRPAGRSSMDAADFLRGLRLSS